jgi:hypothetical protein
MNVGGVREIIGSVVFEANAAAFDGGAAGLPFLSPRMYLFIRFLPMQTTTPMLYYYSDDGIM